MDAFHLVIFSVSLALLLMNVNCCLNSKQQSTCASQITELKRTVTAQQKMIQNLTENLLDLNEELKDQQQMQQNLTWKILDLNEELKGQQQMQQNLTWKILDLNEELEGQQQMQQNLAGEILDLNEELEGQQQMQQNLTGEILDLNEELKSQQQMHQNLTGEILDLNEELQGVHEELNKDDEVQQQIKQNLTEELQDLAEELKKSDEVQQHINLNMTQLLNNLNEKFYTLRKSVSAEVAFTAVVSQQELTDRKPGKTLIFDHVITNTGQAYDHRTGKFIAPLAGIYVFSIHIMVRSEKFQYVALIKIDAIEAKHAVSNSLLFTLRLEAGDKVFIRIAERNGVIEYWHSSFSGWLINSDH